MDPITALGTAASIVNFIQLAASISARINEYYVAGQEVPRSLKDISDRLPLVSAKIQNIQATCQRGDVPHREVLASAVRGCARQVAELESILDKCLPVRSGPGKKDGRFKTFVKALRSVSRDKDLERIQQRLQGYESTLTFFASDFSTPSMERHGREPGLRFEVPRIAVSKFVGRESLLREVAQSFTKEKTITVLHGMGGQGKTQLALQYCHLVRSSRSVYWLDATSSRTLAQSFEMLAFALTKTQPQDLAAARSTVRRLLLESDAPYLIVFDNFDSPTEFDNVAEYMPSSASQGNVLFTSRHRDTRDLGQIIKVPPMTSEEGIVLLLHRSGHERTSQLELYARAIVEHLGGLPLAIDQAGAYIFARNLPLEQFEEHYHHHRQEVLKHTPTIWNYHKISEFEKATRASVFTTWEMSFSQLGETDYERQPYIEFLTCVAFMNHNSVSKLPFRLYHEARKGKVDAGDIFTTDGAWDELKFQDLTVQLLRISLIQSVDMADLGMRISLHPLVAEWLRLRNDAAFQRRCYQRVCIFLKEGIFWYRHHREEWSYQNTEELAAHMSACIDNEKLYASVDEHIMSRSLFKATIPFSELFVLTDRYGEAEDLLKRAFDRCKKDSNEEDDLKTNLAALYAKTGRVKQGVDMLESVLRHKELIRGTESNETIKTAYLLALMLTQCQRLSEAAPLYQRILKHYEDSDGADTPSTPFLLTKWKYATLLCQRKDYTTGMPILRSVLCRFVERFGETHVHTLRALDTLGQFCFECDLIDEAEQMFLRALAGRELLLGKGHSDSLATTSRLGLCYERQGRPTEALPLLRRAHDGLWAIFGPTDPHTLCITRPLWVLYRKYNYPASEQLLDKLLTVESEQFTTLYAEQLSAIIACAMKAYKKSGALGRAEEVFTRALPRFNAETPAESLAVIYDVMAHFYEDSSDYLKALPLYESAQREYAISFGATCAKAREMQQGAVDMHRLLGEDSKAYSPASLLSCEYEFGELESQISRLSMPPSSTKSLDESTLARVLAKKERR